MFTMSVSPKEFPVNEDRVISQGHLIFKLEFVRLSEQKKIGSLVQRELTPKAAEGLSPLHKVVLE